MHGLGEGGAVALMEIEEQPFEIGADLNIHRRRGGLRDAADRIIALAQRTMQNVVDVGGNDQLRDRQPHLCRCIAREDVAEIAGGHREGDRPLRRAEADGGVEIIDDLGHQPRPVDRIDGRQGEATCERLMPEHRLHQRLRIIEAAFDRDIVHIRREHGRHLPALYLRHAALRMQHEDIDLGPARQRIDRSRASIAGGRADDGQVRVALVEEAFEQQPEELKCDILERQRGAMEQLKQPVAMIELDERRDARMIEPLIGSGAQLPQFGVGQRAGNERSHHRDGSFHVAEPAQRSDFGCGKARPDFRHIEPAIRSEPGERDLFER
jgi:hypothetical protein